MSIHLVLGSNRRTNYQGRVVCTAYCKTDATQRLLVPICSARTTLWILMDPSVHCPVTVISTAYKEVRAVINNVFPSAPPNAKLAGGSGTAIDPTGFPFEL